MGLSLALRERLVPGSLHRFVSRGPLPPASSLKGRGRTLCGFLPSYKCRLPFFLECGDTFAMVLGLIQLWLYERFHVEEVLVAG